VICFDELASKRYLIIGVNIIDIKYLRSRSDIFFRLPVAINAPIHVESVDAIHQRHLVYSSMTRRAAYALVEMNAVIEIDVIGKIVDSRPLD
jgi:hypothetical protein